MSDDKNEMTSEIDSLLSESATAPAPDQPAADEPASGEPDAGQEPMPEDETPAEEESEQRPGVAPLSVVKELRDKNREKDAQLNAMQKQIDMLTNLVSQGSRKPKEEAEPEPEEKSPLEEWAEENPDLAPDAATMLAERQYQKDLQAKGVQTEQMQKLKDDIVYSMDYARKVQLSEARMGVGLDVDSVVALARQHNLITPVDQEYAAAQGREAAQTLYGIAVNKIRKAGGVPLKILQTRIASRKSNPKQTRTATTTPRTGLPKELDGYSEITQFLFG